MLLACYTNSMTHTKTPASWITPAMTTANTTQTAQCRACDQAITRDAPGMVWRAEGTDWPASCTGAHWHSPQR